MQTRIDWPPSRGSILSSLLNPKLKDHQIESLVKTLQRNFTTQRENLSQYLDDPDLVSAYTYFYGLTNIPKLWGALEWIDPTSLKGLQETQIVDFGCGPGTYMLALDLISEHPLEMIGVEKSIPMRKQASKLLTQFARKESEFKIVSDLTLVPKTEKARTLIMGHSLNEVGHSYALKLIKTLEPQNLIIIEPGVPESFRECLQLRNNLDTEKWNSFYPCPSMGPCPLEGQSNHWCHQYLKIDHGNEMNQFLAKVGINRTFNPVIFHWYSQVNPPQLNGFRVLRTLSPQKFGFEVFVCGSDQDQNTEQKILIKKSRHKKSYKKLLSLLPGQQVNFKKVKMTSNYWDVEITSVGGQKLE